jgi:hypothetical protein
MLDATITGVQQLEDDLAALAERASDLSPLWDDFAREVWTPRQRAAFNPGQMPRLAPETVKRKKSGTPLVLTGKLRAATYVGSPTNPGKNRAAFGISKGAGVRKLAILHKSSRRLKHRNAVPPLERGERAAFKKMLREFLLGAWGDK